MQKSPPILPANIYAISCNTRKYTFLHVPDVVELCDVVLPREFLYLWVTVSDDAIEGYTTCTQQCHVPLQALFLHV